MTAFSIPNDWELLHDTLVYQQVSALGHSLVPLLDRQGDQMGPWNARLRRKVARGTVRGVAIVRSLRRDRESWTVREETRFSCPDFTASFEEWWSWSFDPTQQFPYRSWSDHRSLTGSLWDELTGDGFGLRLAGSVGHFLHFMGVQRSVARQIIAACEDGGVIDAQDAMISRLALA